MTTTRYDTAGNLINAAATEVHLPTATDPFASTDQNMRLLCRLLTSLGQELTRKLKPVREATCTIGALDSGLYDLPDDYVGMKDQSGWNRSTVHPLVGPVASQEWQAAKAQSTSGSLSVRFRLVSGQFEIAAPLPAEGTVVAIEYVSRAWVKSAGAVTPDKDSVTVASDIVQYEPLLIVKGLKFKWRAEKGFDASFQESEYVSLLEDAVSEAYGAPMLDLNGPASGYRYLDSSNLPETGYGT